MKINFILPFTGLTGGIRVDFIYCNYLVSIGYDVTCYVPMIAYKFNYNFFQRIKASVGNTLKRGTEVKWFDCNFKIKLVPKINDFFVRDADFTIATAWPTAYDVYNLNSLKGKKVYLIQGYEIWSGNKEEVDGSYELELNRIVITNNLKKILLDKFSVESHVIYNGLEESEYIISDKKLNCKKTIMMLYNDDPIKGSKEGIKILNNLYEKYNIRVVLFGVKRGKDIPNNFEFYENPSREKLMNLYRESDIYLFTSKHESWGLPAIEAMANKCAVVGNRVGFLNEIAKNEKEALIIDNFDYKLMCEKVENLLNNDEKLKLLQNNGYKLARNFRWKDSFSKFEEYLKNI
ncbi:glycosyltransferase family 4 protein [Clostridium perfringens]|uniref:glycosyltransferase family 4 protein n=1 Tax=Clostridium perfringens TaxID=1502 RepID=UPI001F06886F|nr:glycosyltransferase family 4 protein [Clostridium perfringens]MCH1961844.1 glycosyltransferase family 4 protein [Clostridium perfringens]MDK0618378.1 glycosyltransferase family 4 protein [Clostridium perfringens]MDM0460705.1 glycosyltransferase family 4 protein [Clostridium perfringens]